VEEEIPPSWQLIDAGKESTATEGNVIGKGYERSHFSNHLVEEHLELLFDICQQQDEHVHGQGVINQRLDMLLEALTDAPEQAQ
jgi:hypothetical protein